MGARQRGGPAGSERSRFEPGPRTNNDTATSAEPHDISARAELHDFARPAAYLNAFSSTHRGPDQHCELLSRHMRGRAGGSGIEHPGAYRREPAAHNFCFAEGLYRLSGTIDTGDSFPVLDLRAGAVIDGQSGGFIGIGGPDGPADRPGTVVLGGIFQHFGNASSPSWVVPMIVRRNGVVDGTEFRDNFNSGLTVQGDDARVVGVYSHHNGRYGLTVTMPCVGCPGPTGVIVEDSEIAFNNTRELSIFDDAGGTKFVSSDGMVVRSNEVHDNYGAGLWFDGFNRNAQVYDNVVYDNRNVGIFWELSYGGTDIHDNTLTDNGLGDGTANWGVNVQLLVSVSDGGLGGGIEVYGNTIDGTAYPLGLLNHSSGTPSTRQVHVHDNVMTLRAPTTRVGAVAIDGRTELFDPAAGNRFDDNTYRVPDLSTAYWAWNGQTLTWAQWQAAGHDVNGTLDLGA